MSCDPKDQVQAVCTSPPLTERQRRGLLYFVRAACDKRRREDAVANDDHREESAA